MEPTRFDPLLPCTCICMFKSLGRQRRRRRKMSFVFRGSRGDLESGFSGFIPERRAMRVHGARPVNSNSLAFLVTVLLLFMILNSHQMPPNFLLWLVLGVFLMATTLRMYATCQQLQAQAQAHVAAASGLFSHTELRLHVPPSIALATRGRLQGLRLQLALLDREFDDLDYETLRALDSDNVPTNSMSEEEINALPVHKYKVLDPENGSSLTKQASTSSSAEKKQDSVSASKKGTEDELTCSVCLEQVTVGEVVRTLPCLHQFHAVCIDPWLRQQGTCPVCKFKAHSGWQEQDDGTDDDDDDDDEASVMRLGNLKKLNLTASYYLEELPDLADATNLEIMEVSNCESLVEIDSSVGNLQKLERLEMICCRNLQVVPTLINLASLQKFAIAGCDQLKKLPDISATITDLTIADTMLEEFTESIRLCSRLETLSIFGSVNPYQFIIQPRLVNLMLERSCADIERIPDCIKYLHGLEELSIVGCPKLATLPELPKSLKILMVYKCESLETLLVPLLGDSQIELLYFFNCFKLGPEARRAITQLRPWEAFLPGRDIPAEFTHRAIGNSLTISSKAYGFRMCVIVSSKSEMEEEGTCRELLCRISINGCPTENCIFPLDYRMQSEHLAIFYTQTILRKDEQQYSEILFEFTSSSQDIEIIECGVQIMRDIFNLLEQTCKDKNYDGNPSENLLQQ